MPDVPAQQGRLGLVPAGAAGDLAIGYLRLSGRQDLGQDEADTPREPQQDRCGALGGLAAAALTAVICDIAFGMEIGIGLALVVGLALGLVGQVVTSRNQCSSELVASRTAATSSLVMAACWTGSMPWSSSCCRMAYSPGHFLILLTPCLSHCPESSSRRHVSDWLSSARTGSIGTQTLDVVAKLGDRFEVVALAAGRNHALLAEQVERFDPQVVVAHADGGTIGGKPVLPTPHGLIEAVTHPDVDIVVAATSGHDAIRAIAVAIEAGDHRHCKQGNDRLRR